MSELMEIEEDRIVVEKHELNLMYMLIAIMFTILALTFYIYGKINGEVVIYKVLTIISLIVMTALYVLANIKITPYEYITFDKEYFRVKTNGIVKEIPTTKIIKFKAESSAYSSKMMRHYIKVRYIDDYKEIKEESFESEVNNQFEKTANKRLRKYKRDTNVELPEDRSNDVYSKLEHEEEIDVFFIGKIKHKKDKFDNSKDLLFVTEEYVPLFFDKNHCYIDFNNIEQYKKYKLREAAFGGEEYVFKESKDTSKNIDIIRINEIRKEVEKDGDVLIYDIKKAKDEIEFTKKNASLAKYYWIFVVIYFFTASMIIGLSENDEELKWAAIIAFSIFILSFFIYIMLKFKLKRDYKKLYEEDDE